MVLFICVSVLATLRFILTLNSASKLAAEQLRKEREATASNSDNFVMENGGIDYTRHRNGKFKTF